MVASREGGVVERREELELLPLAVLSLCECLGPPNPLDRLELDLLAGRDVAGAADGARRRAPLIVGHQAAALQPVHGAVGPDHPVFDCVGRGGGQGSIQRGQCVGHVVGVKEAEPGLEGAVEGPGLDAEEALEHVVPGHRARGLVPPPGAQLAGGQSEREVVGEVGGLLLHEAADGHVVGRAHGADDSTGVVPQRTDDRVGAARTAVASSDAQVAAPGPPRAGDLHDPSGRRTVRRRDHHLLDHPADHFGPRPAVELLGDTVPGEDGPVAVDHDDGPGQAIEHQLGVAEHGLRRRFDLRAQRPPLHARPPA